LYCLRLQSRCALLQCEYYTRHAWKLRIYRVLSQS